MGGAASSLCTGGRPGSQAESDLDDLPPPKGLTREGSVEIGDPAENLPRGSRAGMAGLRNLGNTCFMNAALQCLSHTIPLTDFFLNFPWEAELNEDNPLGAGGDLARAYQAVVHQLWYGKDKTVAPKTFKKTLSKFAPHFSGYDQHDLQELLVFLLDGLHEDLNRVHKKPFVEDAECDGRPEELVAAEAWKNYLLRNKSVIVDLCQGQLKSHLSCCECSYARVKFDPFMYLSLPIPAPAACSGESPTLEECLDEFGKEETLTGDEQWYCPKCKAHVDAKKKMTLWNTPAVLIVHLKRFEFRADGGARKISDHVSFPSKDWSLKPKIAGTQRNEPVYDLYAVARHHGGFGSGHYTAVAKNNRADSDDNKLWYEYDDATCRPLPGGAAAVETPDAFVLMYNQTVVAKEREYRRQSISLPQLWPHMTGTMGRNSIFSPGRPGLPTKKHAV